MDRVGISEVPTKMRLPLILVLLSTITITSYGQESLGKSIFVGDGDLASGSNA